MATRQNDRHELAEAMKELATIASLDERGRIEVLLRTQNRLNNGDAMEYFGYWLDAVCEALKIELEDVDPMENPFS